jgi:DNA-binding NtrC family response regulator
VSQIRLRKYSIAERQVLAAVILSVLNTCSGKISGENGAAKIMGIPATTLESKMRKLGIKREHVAKDGK